jgi:hypothetical protein
LCWKQSETLIANFFDERLAEDRFIIANLAPKRSAFTWVAGAERPIIQLRLRQPAPYFQYLIGF